VQILVTENAVSNVIFVEYNQILGVFAKLRKRPLGASSVCPHGTTRDTLDGFCNEILHLSIFRKSA
jgi:hypothetical protein